jgi:hypothetical protein
MQSLCIIPVYFVGICAPDNIHDAYQAQNKYYAIFILLFIHLAHFCTEIADANLAPRR